MEPKFWIDRWEENRIGFHEDVFHPVLCKYWDTLSIDLSVPVFVPDHLSVYGDQATRFLSGTFST